MEILQASWKEQTLIGIDSIVFKDGTTYLTDINYSNDIGANETFNKFYTFILTKETTLSNLLEDDPDLWSEIQVYGEIDLPDSSKILFGEGEMGNEGFILKLDTTGNLVWSFFSTESNPFIESKNINNEINIFSSHGFSIVINKENNPLEMKVNNHLSQD